MNSLKVWFVLIQNKKEGPYEFKDLKLLPQMTPDTFVWKEGFENWKRARDVPELKALFEDEEESIDLHDKFKVKTFPQEDSTLVIDDSNFPFMFYWIIILILILLYLFYQLFNY